MSSVRSAFSSGKQVRNEVKQSIMTEYNADELVPPSWLNEQFFDQVLLSQHSAHQPKLLTAAISPASQKGDHYASIMFRACLEYQLANTTKTLSVVVKTLPSADSAKSCNIHGKQMFATEVHVYTKVVPAFEAAWKRYGESIKFTGRLLYAALSPQPVIVLEDLCSAGYEILRGRLFNRDELQICLTKLAQWHAVSYKLATEPAQRETVTQLPHGLFAAGQLRSEYMLNGMQTMISALERAVGFEAYLPQLRAIAPHLVARCRHLNDAYAQAVAGPIYVLNHGDFHTRNIMIRRTPDDAAKLSDILLIDFQASFFGPSTFDLRYASYTLFSREFRDNELDELYAYYFERFVECLQKLKFEGQMPCFPDFQKDNKHWSCHELYMMSTFLPLSNLNDHKSREIDINMVFDSATYREEIYSNPDYIEYLRQLLPKCLEQGFLDK